MPAVAAAIAANGLGMMMGFISVITTLARSRKKNIGQEPDEKQKSMGMQANYQSTKVEIPLLYGRSRVGVNRCFLHTSGGGANYLHIIGIIGEGPIEGFSEQVEYGGTNYDPIYFNNKLYPEVDSSIYYELYTGTDTQTYNTTLHNATINLQSAWQENLRHTAYIYIRLDYDRDKYQAVPEITLGIKGLKVLDPNTDTTAYSSNPALCAYDMMTRSPFRGGFGIAAGRILTSSVESCREYCEDKEWTCNLVINTNKSIVDNLQLILNNFRGEIIKSATTFRMMFRDLNEESVVMALDHDNIINGSLSVHGPDAFSTYNAVKINYVEQKGDDFGGSSYKDRSLLMTGTASNYDDGSYNVFEIDCKGLSTLDSVQMMANYYKERYMLYKDFSFVAGQSAAKLEPMDLITISHVMPGWDEKYARVTSIGLNSDFTVSISCIEEHLGFYDDYYDTDLGTFYDTTLPSPTAAPVNVTGVSLTEEVYYYRNRSFTRLKLDFDPPDPEDDPFFDYAEVYLKIGSGDYKYMTRSEGNYLVDPVEEGETYYLKLRSVNIYGVRQSDLTATVVSLTVVGKTDVPTSLSSMTAVANGDSVSIFADPIPDPDVEGYEVRLGSAWDGAIFVSFNKNCSLRLNGVRPGTHTFWMSPRDNSGNYSATPVSASVKVFVPPGFSELATYGSWAFDFTTGTHSNTEHETYATEDAMKCSHTSGVLTGTWTSPTWDLNAVEDVRIWGDFRAAFESGDTTWNGAAPTQTWNELGADNSWMEIFDPAAAGKVQAILFFSEDNSTWSEVDFFEVLCAEVTARYIKVEVTLTDPTLDSNLHLKELNLLAYEGPQ